VKHFLIRSARRAEWRIPLPPERFSRSIIPGSQQSTPRHHWSLISLLHRGRRPRWGRPPPSTLAKPRAPQPAAVPSNPPHRSRLFLPLRRSPVTPQTATESTALAPGDCTSISVWSTLVSVHSLIDSTG